MILGFTGTRLGMSERQKAHFRALVEEVEPVEFHHGDCVGSDAEAHAIVRELAPRCRIVVHPGDMPDLRANCAADEILPVKENLDRNKDIVAAVEMMVAAPDGPERTRSGTWATVRNCRKVGRKIVVLPT